MPEPTLIVWILGGVAAVLVGISKTALPGVSTVAIAAFAAVLPARTSTGVLLLLLITGDVFALLAYRRHANWRILLRLVPPVLVGLLGGVLFLALADDAVVRLAIGAILLVMIAVTLWRRRRTSRDAEPGVAHPVATVVYGGLGGFTTMVANAGGPVMSMYFLSTRMPVQMFLGTAAWFFAVVNIVKLPFLIGIGIIDLDVLAFDVWLMPLVVVGALIGIRIASRISQRIFDRVVIVLTVIGALYLLVSELF